MRWMLAIVLALTAGAAWYLGSRPGGGAGVDTPGAAATRAGPADRSLRASPVVAARVRQGKLDIYLDALGTVTPLNAVQVNSRVDGQLMSIAFREGQMVKAGELLARIDPRPFEVQLALATAQLARDQAMLDGALVDAERYAALLTQDSIARQQVDTQDTLVRQLRAAVQADQGAVDNARLQMSWSRVTAPISGRVGLRQIGPGSFVRASDPGGIVVITQLQPIAVVFPIPADALPRVMQRLRSDERIRVDIYDRAQQERLGSGRLLAADNQIDPSTGTIKLKAEYRNADGALFANQFVNVKLLVQTLPEATLVPTAALQRGAAGPFVYVVKPDGSVGVAPVKTGPTQGEVTVIERGVGAGALVVIDGADGLREGAKVELVRRGAATGPALDAPGRSGEEGEIPRPPGRAASAGA